LERFAYLFFSQEDADYVINHSDAVALIYQQESKGLGDKIKKDISLTFPPRNRSFSNWVLPGIRV